MASGHLKIKKGLFMYLYWPLGITLLRVYSPDHMLCTIDFQFLWDRFVGGGSCFLVLHPPAGCPEKNEKTVSDSVDILKYWLAWMVHKTSVDAEFYSGQDSHTDRQTHTDGNPRSDDGLL